jgi:uncharacterized protein
VPPPTEPTERRDGLADQRYFATIAALQGKPLPMNPSPDAPTSTPPQRRWRPLNAVDRRVVGVLAEKAKTTPDIYPMSLNAICTGCNQKSNRSPLMELESDGVEESLDRLREMGAVGLVQGSGRVAKYRHYLYEWLGVDKVELAVMTELLLRGDQTVGELRGRAARMEPIADLAALRPILDSLKAKGLVIAITPEGRGQVIGHALLKPQELEALKAKHQGGGCPDFRVSENGTVPFGPRDKAADESPNATAARSGASAVARSDDSEDGAVALLRRELAELREQVAQLRCDFDEQRDQQQRLANG